MSILALLCGGLLDGPVRDMAPPGLTRVAFLGHEPWQWLGLVAALALAYPVGRFGSFVATRATLFFTARTTPPVDDALVIAGRRPLRLALGVVAFREASEWLEPSKSLTKLIEHAAFSLLGLAFAWFAISALRVIADWVAQRAGVDTDEMKTRAFRTQIIFLRRIATAAIVIIAIAMFLLQFEIVRSVGLSLLASAGLVGIVLGLAAQKTIGAVIAGVQLSITQPIRIGDTVYVDKDWGDIEEINLTYVVVKLWDGRRQVIPISRFLDQPFENWTKLDSRITGAVHLPVDFTAPLEKIRPELERLCKENSRWDGRVAELRVVDATEGGIVLRATMSAATPNDAAALRLDVREGLVTFLRQLDGGAYWPKRGPAPPAPAPRP